MKTNTTRSVEDIGSSMNALLCNLDGTNSFTGGYVDEHGNAVERTKHTHPYSYDGFIQWRGGENKEANGTTYSDRLLQWDFAKHDELCLKHFGNKGQYWNNRGPEQIEAFLRDWEDNQKLKLVFVMEYCNASSGYPVWRFDYAA